MAEQRHEAALAVIGAASIFEEGTDVVGELTVVLKKKSMAGVGIDL